MRRLTDTSTTWVVWKNVESALNGTGDIDSAASGAEWPVIEREFLRWADESALGPTVVCRHIPGGLNLIAIPPEEPSFLELGVKATRIFRGSVLFSIGDLRPLIENDSRGFRRVRPGAEGLFKFLLNGTRWGGRPDWDGMREKRVLELLEADRDGVRMAARLLGPAEPLVLASVRSAVQGRWNGGAAFLVDSWAILRGIQAPVQMARRARFRLRTTRRCPIVRAILHDHRGIPDDRAAWIREVARTHRVYGVTPPLPGRGPGT